MVTAEDVSLGTDVFTIGYPWTSGNSKTYTEGVVNALDPWDDQRIFQISAQLHAGNSTACADSTSTIDPILDREELM
jgi:hypothetical protein